MTLDDAITKISLFHGSPMSVLSDCLRGMICAAPGNDLIAVDFSNIEGRGLPWLAGEDWKLDAFREWDASVILDDKGKPVRKKDGEKQYSKPDIYLIGATKILTNLGRPPEKPLTKKSPERQGYGKVPELACGYGGGVGAFQSMARIYGVQVTDDEADQIKTAWRDEHPAIVQYWRNLEDAALNAVRYPGQIYQAGAPGREVRFRKNGSFLWCQLPSKRLLCYPYPKLVNKLMPWRDRHGNPVWKEALQFKGVDSLTKAWTDQDTYGGSLAENITQAICRDILASAMLRLSQHGYNIVMHVHDEVVAEVAEGFGSVEDVEDLMCIPPDWAKGFPITAEGWRGKRYRK